MSVSKKWGTGGDAFAEAMAVTGVAILVAILVSKVSIPEVSSWWFAGGGVVLLAGGLILRFVLWRKRAKIRKSSPVTDGAPPREEWRKTDGEKEGMEHLLNATYFAHQNMADSTRQMQIRASWLLAVNVTLAGFAWYQKIYFPAFLFSLAFWYMIFTLWPYKSLSKWDTIPDIYNRIGKEDALDIAEEILRPFWEKPKGDSVISSLAREVEIRYRCYFVGVALMVVAQVAIMYQLLREGGIT